MNYPYLCRNIKTIKMAYKLTEDRIAQGTNIDEITPSELDFSSDGFSVLDFEFMCLRAQNEDELNEMC